MGDMPPMTLELSKDKTFTIDLPFETDVLNFTTDNDRIAKVDENGLVTPVSNGQCIIHTDADGIQFHTVVNVTGMASMYDSEKVL